MNSLNAIKLPMPGDVYCYAEGNAAVRKESVHASLQMNSFNRFQSDIQIKIAQFREKIQKSRSFLTQIMLFPE